MSVENASILLHLILCYSKYFQHHLIPYVLDNVLQMCILICVNVAKFEKKFKDLFLLRSFQSISYDIAGNKIFIT